ncbi:PfkB family carbohydrate kinase [Maritalea porphyrae]|uniref:Carbohydrate kinase n=1 Tax=Maritalea porphyrae TaxID=880732 RepID=A0ABQ5UKL3_9HYPH|nr:PfkB family carbohydrate kinase [Maritalea porphyrae]GLQ15825.1 carbohydrate kinase [Maritalea porphyrae]
MSLTNLEARLLAQIKAQPFATQKELGEALGISRASVANYIERLQSKGLILGRAYVFAETPAVTCIGGAVLDRILRLQSEGIPHTSQPGTSSETRGGVARNVAENLAQLGESVKLISVVGNDDAGRAVIEATSSVGVDTTLVERKNIGVTGTYTAIMQPTGELYLGIADMGIIDHLDAQVIDRDWQHIVSSRLVFADTNCSASLLSVLIKRCHNNDLPLALDAVSVPKFQRLPNNLTGVEYLFCNMDEARSVHGDLSAESLAKQFQLRGAKNVVITDGSNPVTCLCPEGIAKIETPKTEIVDVSGAGDAFVAGFLHTILQEKSAFDATRAGVVAAGLTVQSELRNSPDLTAQIVAQKAQDLAFQRT